MSLDLALIAHRYRIGRANPETLAYLLDRINDELAQRVEETAADTARWLLIDYSSSRLALPGQVERLSLVEGQGMTELRNIPDQSVDGILINVQMAWLDHGELLIHARRVLAPGGHLLFATFGPDTLFELQEAWCQVDALPHVHPFVDLHHLGDAMVKCGLEKPILDSDWIGVEYDDVDLLMTDLRGAGFHNVLPQRRKTLTGKNRLEMLRNRFQSAAGPARITWEVTYGYAQRPTAPDLSGTSGIRVNLTP